MKAPAIMAAAFGIVVWVAVVLATGRSEAWDHGAYWQIGYPLFVVASFILGWRYPQGAWRWGPILMVAQVLPLALLGPSFGLFPLGCVVLAFLSLPLMLTGRIGAWSRHWRRTAE